MRRSTGLIAVAALSFGCRALQIDGGEPLNPPPKLASGRSCPRLLELGATNQGLGGIIVEEDRELGILASVELVGGRWETKAQMIRPVRDGYSGSLSKSGDALVAIPSRLGLGPPPEIFITAAAGWQAVPFDVGLDTSQQIFVSQVTALDRGRGTIQLREGSTSRAFLLGDGSWTDIGERGGFSLHAGRDGALWRATYPESDAGTVALGEWNGSEWVSMPFAFEVSERGVIRHLIPRGESVSALYQTTTIFHQETFSIFELRAGGASLLARDPVAGLQFADDPFALDAEGRPIVSARGGEDRANVGEFPLRAFRFEDGAWRTLFEASFPEQLLYSGSEVVGDDLIVSWTDTAQRIDTGFEHYSDCALRMFRVPLR